MAATDDCDCCAGTAIATPSPKNNLPGQPALAYRVGTWATFRETLLARLSGVDFPALGGLTTRDGADFTVALCDAFAVLADVLTFYQERIANESYLRTATQRRSVLELAALIGYRLGPGVAAATGLAFTLEAAPGAPELAARPVTIPAGTRVQSVADADQTAQSFETDAPFTAQVEWNAIPAQQSEPVPLVPSATVEIYVAGSATQVQPGDPILLVDEKRIHDPTDTHWNVRWVEVVEPDPIRAVTRLAWTDPLDQAMAGVETSHRGVRVHRFKQRATLFGSQAPAPRLLKRKNDDDFNKNFDANDEWIGIRIADGSDEVDLDALYSKVVKGSWFVLTGGDEPPPPLLQLVGGDGDLLQADASSLDDLLLDASDSSSLLSVIPTGQEFDLQVPPADEAVAAAVTPAADFMDLCRALSVSQRSRSDFGISAKISRLRADKPDNLPLFNPRKAVVLAESEELTFVERPLLYPLYGGAIGLDVLATDLQPGKLLGVSGKCQRVKVGVTTDGVAFGGQPERVAKPNESFVMLAPPVDDATGILIDPTGIDPARPSAFAVIRWTVADHKGAPITITAAAGLLALTPALARDKPVTELCTIADTADAVTSDDERTTVTLASPLANCYDRTTVTVNANVVSATHGETTKEIVGSGDARQAGQRFRLKQAPLTYVPSAADPTGRAATLQLRVNDIAWTEVPSLYGAGALDRVYELRQDDDGTTTVRFGDGVIGARVPTGNSNVRAVYRRGLGAAGNLRAGQLTTLLTRPLGVKTVTNPGPSVGGQDAETLDRARRNAPVKVLTIDRVVSPDDYAAFSQTFAGIAKAHALWIPAHPRGMYVTVAGVAGAALPDGGDDMKALASALRAFGDALLPLTVRSYSAVSFALNAAVEVVPGYDGKAVRAAAVQALRARFSFDARDLGQPVTVDEVYAVIQSVPGVLAADITQLYRLDPGAQPALVPRLPAALPAVQPDGSVSVAELLTLAADPLALGVMT